MARRFTLLLTACLLVMTLVLPAQAAPRHVWLAIAEDSGAYAEAAAVLRAELGGDIEISSDVWPRLFESAKAPPDLVVTVGVAALDGTLDGLSRMGSAWARVPVLATLLPQAVFDARQASAAIVNRPFSAVVLDQPLARQMALIRRSIPEHKRVGVLVGPQTQPMLTALQRAAGNAGLSVLASPAVTGSEGLYPALKTILVDAQLILALPDPAIYNATSLQNILLTTYRARVPLVAFSSAYVKAGAVLAVYSTPAQIARRAAEMVRAWQAGRGLPPPQAAREFTVSTNAKVAASIGLALDDAAQIAEDLRRLESGR